MTEKVILTPIDAIIHRRNRPKSLTVSIRVVTQEALLAILDRASSPFRIKSAPAILPLDHFMRGCFRPLSVFKKRYGKGNHSSLAATALELYFERCLDRLHRGGRAAILPLHKKLYAN
jgi:hypothetical protein